MRQSKTTEDFVYRGQSLPGIPYLIDKDSYPVSSVTNYMLHLVLERGRVNSPKTWQAHSDALYDYFAWLEERGLVWDEEPKLTPSGKEASNLSLYVRWSREVYRKPNGERLKNSTINVRLVCIEGFYKWGKNIARLINWLPFYTKIKPVSQGHPRAFAHTHGQKQVESSEQRLPVHRTPPKLLNLD